MTDIFKIFFWFSCYFSFLSVFDEILFVFVKLPVCGILALFVVMQPVRQTARAAFVVPAGCIEIFAVSVGLFVLFMWPFGGVGSGFLLDQLVLFGFPYELFGQLCCFLFECLTGRKVLWVIVGGGPLVLVD